MTFLSSSLVGKKVTKVPRRVASELMVTSNKGRYTVDGKNPAPVDSLSHYLQGFIHPRWLFGISEPSTVVGSNWKNNTLPF